jgi:hypothetical protein
LVYTTLQAFFKPVLTAHFLNERGFYCTPFKTLHMKHALLAAGVVLLAACNASETPATAVSNADSAAAAGAAATTGLDSTGFQSLFDGKTTAGWHTYGKTTASPAWKAADGVLSLDTSIKDAGDLVTDNAYENFHLKMEWKISKNGNSGVIFLIQEDTAKYDKTYKSGPEMQVLDNDGHPDGKILKHRAGDLYDLIKSSAEPVKPVGEWNQAEIMVNKGKLDLVLNGVTTVSTTLGDDNWKKLVAGSKFKAMPNWGTFTSGKIGLQDHGNMVSYRNIQIKKL